MTEEKKKRKRKRVYKRPYKLTEEVTETIYKHLRAGAFAKHAAEAAGIDERTFQNWMKWAEEGQRPYQEFAATVMRIRAEDVVRAQSIITRAQLGRIDGDWKAAAWNLERKYPKQYGQAALAAAASVTLRPGGGAANSGDDDGTTTVQFYLPDNGRRPQDPD